MKLYKLFLITLMITQASYVFAKCENKISISQAIKVINLEPAGFPKCLPNEQCLCYDGIQWEGAELVDNYVDDITKPIYEAKSNVTLCSGEEACRLALSELVCLNETQGYIDALFTEVYCTKVIGYEQMLDGKKLVNDSVKMAAWETKKAEQEAKRQERLDRINQLKTKLKTPADLSNAEINELLRLEEQ